MGRPSRCTNTINRVSIPVGPPSVQRYGEYVKCYDWADLLLLIVYALLCLFSMTANHCNSTPSSVRLRSISTAPRFIKNDATGPAIHPNTLAK